MHIVATLVRDLGFLLYGGPLIAFTILVLLADRVSRDEPWRVVRVLQSWGPGLGVSLGFTVLGALSLRWLDHGQFSWGWDNLTQLWDLALWLSFLALWISNVRLEVWTLEPLRKLDRDGVLSDPVAYRERLGGVRVHLVFHTLLIVSVVVLKTITETMG